MWLEGDYVCCVYTYFSVFIVATYRFYNRDYHKRWHCSDPGLPSSASVEHNASFPTWDRTTWDLHCTLSLLSNPPSSPLGHVVGSGPCVLEDPVLDNFRVDV